ncbi:DJ-1/PfpI/YhbO family deglycase/protease [Mycobacteroides chelonae]|uniref:DJ-1/PfpI/YhbO family deglycase/protease n=1 Tax=Mycobacteroides chelonae TaxID=1774 RepID=UPI001E28E31B|nr:DJ-1/PfpI/YhbO family deglycase/protease [Mycobacteroides chelonae]
MSQIGVEHDELMLPRERLQSAGIRAVIASPSGAPVQTFRNDTDKDVVVQADMALETVAATEFDVLVVPGGTVNADNIRANTKALGLAQSFAEAGKPVAAICHAPWLLVDADLLPGKTLTSYHTMRRDVVNAGGEWVDQPVVFDATNGWPLITSRSPGDLTDYSAAIIEALSSRRES